MTAPVERCEDCRHYHQPGPCYPTEQERQRDQGWRLYRTARVMTFKNASNEEDEGQQ